VALPAAQAAAAAAAGKKELANFYRFQQRDKRRNGEPDYLQITLSSST
jgi:hypothetical protein